jgi:hypothetical protein
VSSARFWKILISIIWGILGIPVAMFIFAVFIVLIFPFGGGIQHAMYAHVPGGNLGGAKFVFAGFLGATALVTSFLHWTRYPLPWYGTATLVSLIGFRLWEPTMYSDTTAPLCCSLLDRDKTLNLRPRLKRSLSLLSLPNFSSKV